jgi:hypothetical protein
MPHVGWTRFPRRSTTSLKHCRLRLKLGPFSRLSQRNLQLPCSWLTRVRRNGLWNYALASRYPRVANSRWFEDIAGRHLAAVAATLLPDVVSAAQERGRARDLEATVAELLIELGG